MVSMLGFFLFNITIMTAKMCTLCEERERERGTWARNEPSNQHQIVLLLVRSAKGGGGGRHKLKKKKKRGEGGKRHFFS